MTEADKAIINDLWRRWYHVLIGQDALRREFTETLAQARAEGRRQMREEAAQEAISCRFLDVSPSGYGRRMCDEVASFIRALPDHPEDAG